MPILLVRRQGTNNKDPSSRWITDSISNAFFSQPYSFLQVLLTDSQVNLEDVDDNGDG